MERDVPGIDDPDSDWGHRRENLRHEVQVPARITDRLGVTSNAIIEDISSTGMALRIEPVAAKAGSEPFQKDTVATLVFVVGDAQIEVAGRIMWRTPLALGVRFVEVGPALRYALRDLAEAAVSARVEDAEQRRPTLSGSQRTILHACRKSLQQQLPNIIWVMRTELVNALRLAATGAVAGETQALLADATACEKHGMAITRTIEHHVLASFAEASDLNETQELTLMQLRAAASGESGGLDVMNNPATEHGARVTTLAHTVEERYKTRFFELNVRLANVLGHPLDAATNPLVPSNLCRIFWAAVLDSCASPRIERHLQQVMLREVMPLVGELYTALNAVLDEYGAKRVFDVRRSD
ncbi:MAG: DUF1631 family protein [Gammaproteobacteria bacterium]|nr:DUF1631 family protein [Gammaproteobacteria bacterium]